MTTEAVNALVRALVSHVRKNVSKQSKFLSPDPAWIMHDPHGLLVLLHEHTEVTPEQIDAWMIEAESAS